MIGFIIEQLPFIGISCAIGAAVGGLSEILEAKERFESATKEGILRGLLGGALYGLAIVLGFFVFVFLLVTCSSNKFPSRWPL